jgi:hypothetical protein
MATNPTDGTPSPLVQRVRNILLQPKSEWPVIDAEPATIGSIYRNYVLILAAIPVIAFAVGSLLFGINLFFVTIRPSISSVITTAILQYADNLIAVYVVALVIEALATTFGGVKNRVQAFKLAAYSYTAAWVAGVVMLMPSLAILALLASLYGFYLLYLGLPILMKSPADKTIAYFAAVVVTAIVVGLILGAVVSAVQRATTPSVTGPGGYSITTG